MVPKAIISQLYVMVLLSFLENVFCIPCVSVYACTCFSVFKCVHWT